jgi:carboxymethylenebutenolidase
MDKLEIQTRDGLCPSYLFQPSQEGSHPGVLMYMDGVGIRPAMLEVAERVASYGYAVLLPDLYYRAGPYEPMNAHTVFSDPEQRKVMMAKFGTATSANVMADTQSFLDTLDAHPGVRPGPYGVVGYCLGGFMTLTAAGTYPERFAAAASYHGGRLANDAPDSPHKLAPRIQARLYVAGASDDPSFPDDMKERLASALLEGGVSCRIETYPARHGWVLRDTPVYDAAASERHYETLIALLRDALR